ncbi:MAG: hypothetical protein RDV48_15795 [Candidatus Eremiobacteraeota bacterium]|nr:hypothetical protein [Candidatus Eremiobacteraeota bacterium]
MNTSIRGCSTLAAIVMFVFLLLGGYPLEASGVPYEINLSSRLLINSYNILADGCEVPDYVTPMRLDLQSDNGTFCALVIREKVDKASPLYHIISSMKMGAAEKKQLLRNITDGTLIIYFDAGARPDRLLNNRMIFEAELERAGFSKSDIKPDFIVLSHSHNGEIVALQEALPNTPVFVTLDMKNGIVLEDRTIPIKNKVILKPGVTPLTDHISLISTVFQMAPPTKVIQKGQIFNRKKDSSDPPEYESALAVNTRDGVALFGTCMHCSFLGVVKTAMKFYRKDIILYCGGFENDSSAIPKALKLSPSMEFYLHHCAPVESLQWKYGESRIHRIRLGERVLINPY